METLLIIPAAAALIGFALSLAVHVAALGGAKLFPHAEFLHMGMFVVFIPALFSSRGILRNVRMNQKDVWKLLLLGCPGWVKKVFYLLFPYVIANFIFFIITIPKSLHTNQGEMPVQVLRGFSGHWMIFYWASFAILLSRIRTKGQLTQNCPVCSTISSPFDRYCAKCGNKLSPQSP